MLVTLLMRRVLIMKAGCDELVFLDITATHEKRDTTVEMVKRVADQVFIPFTVGGGIRSVEDMNKMLKIWCGQGRG